MDSDLFLTVGICLALITLPAHLNAWVAGRVSRVGAIVTIAAMAMIALAVQHHPGGYVASDIPSVMLKVLRRYFV